MDTDISDSDANLYKSDETCKKRPEIGHIPAVIGTLICERWEIFIL